jgi:hypothetical protein
MPLSRHGPGRPEDSIWDLSLRRYDGARMRWQARGTYFVP